MCVKTSVSINYFLNSVKWIILKCYNLVKFNIIFIYYSTYGSSILRDNIHHFPNLLTFYSFRFEIKQTEGAFNQLTYELIIHGVEREDYGTYECNMGNNIGTQRSSIQVQLKG